MLNRFVLFPLLLLAGCCRPEGGFPPPPPMQRLPLFGNLTVTPDAGSASSQTFTVRLDMAPGKAEPSYVGLLINGSDTGAEACYLFANLANGHPRLVNDSGSGATELPGPGDLANRQCEVHADATVVERQPNAILARFAVKFRPTFAGSKKLYVIAEGAGGVSTGIQLAGEFQVP